MKPQTELLEQRIRERGFRLTRQRTIVLEELSKFDTHPRADELYRLVRRRIPHISFGTVYRNLKTLKELGLITELKAGKDSARFDPRTDQHHHVTCLSCKKVLDVDVPVELQAAKSVARDTGYTISHYQLEFYGQCPKCRALAEH